MGPAAQVAPRTPTADDGGFSQGFDALRKRSVEQYTEDETLLRPLGIALGAASALLLLGSILSWGVARILDGFPLAQVLVAVAAVAGFAGAYLGLYNEQRRVGGWSAVGGGALAFLALVIAAKQAGVGWGFLISFVAALAVGALGVAAMSEWGVAPPQRRSDEDAG